MYRRGERRERRRGLVRAAVATAAAMVLSVGALAAAVPASAAPLARAGSGDPTPPTGTSHTSNQAPPALDLSDPNLLAAATWGVSDGKPFYKLLKGEMAEPYTPRVPKPHPSPTGGITPDTSYGSNAVCTETIYDIALTGFTFDWETLQFCSGSYGQQKMTSWMERSSWSGWRGYGSKGSTGLTSSDWLNTWWSLGCDSNGGYYDYRAGAEGYASGIGWGPNIFSTNKLSHYKCGTSPT